MRKIAIFVEGQTEQIFVVRLLREVAGANHILFNTQRLVGKTYILQSSDNVPDRRFFALVVDCCSDGAVATAIRDRHQGLCDAGYQTIIGLRDLAPLMLNDLPSLKEKLAALLPTAPIEAKIFIAVREIEAWFAQEDTHFLRISEQCTRDAILGATGYDIESGFAETIERPASFLHAAYGCGGRAYRKTKRHVERTVSVLDYERMYLINRAKLPSLNDFLSHVEGFLAA